MSGIAIFSGFEGISISGKVAYKVEAVTPLTIGSGRSELNPLAPDIPLLKDSQGRPVIPGSTFKGFVRSGMERVLVSLGIAASGRLLSDLMGATRPEAYGSRLLFSDASVEGEYRVEVREHVALDPSRMSVRHGPFKQEYVSPRARFKGMISFRNLPPSFLSLLAPIESLSERGVFRLGRSKSRGYGQVRVTFGDVELTTVTPPDGGAKFVFLFPLTGWRILVEVSTSGDSLIVKDDFSDCDLEAEIVERNFLINSRLNWSNVKGCLDNLIGRLRGT